MRARETIVIVGHNVREAQDIAMQRRDEDRGKHVVILGMGGTPWHRAEGLRVHEFIASQWAREHRSWPDLHECLVRSQVKTGVPVSE